jgi:Spy/CpxP family protein refolding chaperone
MKTLMPLKTLALSLAVATLAGCGQGTLLSALSSSGADVTSQLAAGQRPGGKGGKLGGDKGGPFAQFAALSLTDEQKAQLQAIAEKYKPEAPEAGTKPEHPGARVQALLTAETVDVEALKAALAAQPAPPADKADNRLAQLVETRAVLTAEQIATLVEQLKAEPTVTRPSPDANRPAPADRSAELAAKLNLTAEQQVAFDAYQAKLAANRPAAPEADPRAAERAAMVTFWETGDTAALEAAKPARVAPVVPVDEIVALAGVLTLEQRRQVFGHAFGGPGKGGHGGPHGDKGGKPGKGGHGHEGGKGGFGGHRGPGGEAPVPAPEAEV